jgi:hypothetical protein
VIPPVRTDVCYACCKYHPVCSTCIVTHERLLVLIGVSIDMSSCTYRYEKMAVERVLTDMVQRADVFMDKYVR